MVPPVGGDAVVPSGLGFPFGGTAVCIVYTAMSKGNTHPTIMTREVQGVFMRAWRVG